MSDSTCTQCSNAPSSCSCNECACGVCRNGDCSCRAGKTRLDRLIEAESLPDLGQLYKAAQSKGLIKPGSINSPSK